MRISFALRSGFLLGERYRLRASCIVIVLPPAAKRPALRLRSYALLIASQSTPSWRQNSSSSAITTARLRFSEIASEATQVQRSSILRPFARACLLRISI